MGKAKARSTLGPDDTRVLVVDDDDRILRLLEQYLSREGYAVEVAVDGVELHEKIDSFRPHLLILDLMLPGEDGLTLARKVRQRSSVPIVMLTGKTDTIDKVVGLEVGADDYITKPFDQRELLARVRAVLRRTAHTDDEVESSPELYSFADWRLDLTAAELYRADGERVHLTSYEYRILSEMVQQPNRVFSRDQLLGFLDSRGRLPYDRTIDVLIGKLRKKIERDPGNPALIKSVRGLGYKFTTKVERGRA